MNITKTESPVTLHSLRSFPLSRKYLHLFVVLLLGVVGYFIGPKDLPLGGYTAEIDVFLTNGTLSLTYPFALGTAAGQSVTDTQLVGDYQVVIEAQDAYRYGLGQSDDLNRTGFRRALILGIDYSATVGGIGSAIGTPANILAMTFLSDFADADLGFVDWFSYGLPVVIIMIPIIWLYLILVFRVKLNQIGPHLSRGAYNQELPGGCAGRDWDSYFEFWRYLDLAMVGRYYVLENSG